MRLAGKIVACCLVLALIVPGCRKKEGAAKITPQLRIGFALADMRRDGNRVLKTEVTRRAGKDRVRVLWRDAKNDPVQQESDIETLLKQKVKVVVLQPVDPRAAPALVRRLATARTRVITLETLPANSPLDGYVASDHTRAGELAARFVTERLPAGKPARVLLLQGDTADSMAREIAAAARAALGGVASLSVEASEQPRYDPAAAGSAVQQALAKGPVDAVIATDSRLIVGALDLLRTRDLLERVLTVGVGANRNALGALLAGEHDAEVDVRPDLLGRYLYDAALGLARDGRWNYDTRVSSGDYSIPARIVPVRLIRPENTFLLEEQLKGVSPPPRNKKRPSGEGGQGQSSGQGQGGAEGEGAAGQRKTKLRITTQEGKTVEVKIEGEVKKIESTPAGGPAGGGGQ
ncbi:MAG: sugar ABC transporter substrate-binding protein [Desulfotomaculales bacterium]